MIWDKFFGGSAPEAPAVPAAKQAELPLGTPDLVSAETLGALATDVDLQLHAIEQLILQSGQDARRFSRSLKQGAADLSNPERAAQALTQLVELTRDMVEKTRAAEAQLRHQTDAMARISDGLKTVRQTSKGRPALLRNRLEFERELGAAVERARTSREPISIAFCNVDQFAAVNDAHGPATGDRVIAFIGSLMDQIIDNRGFVCRGLGAEFFILFEGKTARQAQDITEEAREALAERNIVDRQSGRRIGHLDFSAGVATLGADLNADLMVARAERALGRAKITRPGSVKLGY